MNIRTLILLFFLPICAFAQVETEQIWSHSDLEETDDTSHINTDTLSVGRADLEIYDVAMRYTWRLDSLRHAYQRWHYTGSDTLSNPYYASLFAYPSLLRRTLRRTIGSPTPTYGIQDPQIARATAIDNVLIRSYVAQPWSVKPEINEPRLIPPSTSPQVTHTSPPPILITPDLPTPDDTPDLVTPDFNVVVHRPNFWTFKADMSLQFMQNYISDNWYKGGESNNSLLANVLIEANYDNKRKLTFTNKLEMKLGFYSSKSDSIHRYKTNNDLFRLTNKLGLQASKHWYYTVMLQSWSQFYHGFKSNNPNLFSDFLAPFYSQLSIGMDYKLDVKNFKLEATLSPFAAKYKYVRRYFLATSFGIDDGHHTDLEYGSSITATATWTPFQNVTWRSRIYWFTDYSKTTVEWENTLMFKINNFLRTELFLYPRFDDGVARKDGHSYLQFKEYLSLGFSYSF